MKKFNDLTGNRTHYLPACLKQLLYHVHLANVLVSQQKIRMHFSSIIRTLHVSPSPQLYHHINISLTHSPPSCRGHEHAYERGIMALRNKISFRSHQVHYFRVQANFFCFKISQAPVTGCFIIIHKLEMVRALGVHYNCIS